MIEKAFQMTQSDRHTIEKVIADENFHFNRMILNKNEGLPEHFSNSNVYMIVVKVPAPEKQAVPTRRI